MSLAKPAKQPRASVSARKHGGATNHQAGQSAELSVIADYEARGYRLLHHRWRGKAGEVDLIFAGRDNVVFVEVKKSRNFDRALRALGTRQVGRLLRAAEEFIGTQERGLLTQMRFDVAVMNDTGELRIVENALMA